MLNAFRHHGVPRHPGRSHSISELPCAQRLSASGSFAASSESTGGTLSSGAQRLSASRSFAASRVGVRFGSSACCAQRLSASRSFADPAPRGLSCSGGVLNAFRHHGVSRIGDHTYWIVYTVCSTPFGITEFRGRSRTRGHAKSRASAQRLSASRSFAVNGDQVQTPNIPQCSTPFGIAEFRGRELLYAQQIQPECSTPFGITEFRGWTTTSRCSPWRSAQRLSASRSFTDKATGKGLQRGDMCSTPFGITEFRGTSAASATSPGTGAQRLSASRSLAVDVPLEDRRAVEVLNAFRHHGVSRRGYPWLARDCSGSAQRLRHHGVSRVRVVPVTHVAVWCSTPFGITEFRGG